MKRFINKIKETLGIKDMINCSDGKYIVHDIRHENYSPERILYTREYLKKFNPEIMNINNTPRLIIIIDSSYDLNKLNGYLFDHDESLAEVVDDNNIDKRVSGSVFFS